MILFPHSEKEQMFFLSNSWILFLECCPFITYTEILFLCYGDVCWTFKNSDLQLEAIQKLAGLVHLGFFI